MIFPNTGTFSLYYLKIFKIVCVPNEKETWTNVLFLPYGLEFPGCAYYKSCDPVLAKWTTHYKGYCDGLCLVLKPEGKYCDSSDDDNVHFKSK